MKTGKKKKKQPTRFEGQKFSILRASTLYQNVYWTKKTKKLPGIHICKSLAEDKPASDQYQGQKQ